MGIETVLADLNAEQQTAVTTEHASVLVLAGAGTGKTKTIVARAAYLISQGVPAHHIQIVTFTRRAAHELVMRVQAALGEQAAGLRASTFHTFCMAILRRYPNQFDLAGMMVIDADDQLSLFRLAVAEVKEELKIDEKERLIPKVKTLQEIYSYARNTQTKLGEVLLKFLGDDQSQMIETHVDASESTHIKLDQTIAKIMRRYEVHKNRNAYLDYDDILEYVAKTLQHSPHFADKIVEQNPYLLIDEMQDTNPLQWLLISNFVGRSKLFCVGDDAQSIYGFRGADFQNIHRFGEKVPNAHILTLTQNYRSTQAILDLSNWLLADSPLGYNKHLRAQRPNGELPTLHYFSDEFCQASFIVDSIVQRYQAGADYRDFMILLRTAYAGRLIESALMAANIPYRFIGGIKFFEAAHIKDVLSLLRVAENPKDSLGWMRFLTLWQGVGEVTAGRLSEKMIEATDIDEIVGVLDDCKKLPKDAKITETYRYLITLLQNPVQAIQVAKQLLEERLQHKYGNYDIRAKDFVLVEQLAAQHPTVADFLEVYTLEPINETQITNRSEEDCVVLITIHSAKGTEAPVCFLPNMVAGQYPHSRATTLDEIEEERRVLYVGLTRAKNELILSSYQSVHGGLRGNSWHGKAGVIKDCFLAKTPSRYLKNNADQQQLQKVDDNFQGKPVRVNIGIMDDDIVF